MSGDVRGSHAGSHGGRPLLRVSDLAISFEAGGARDGARVQATHGVDLAVWPGQAVAVVGESGSGKSVTALALLGLLPRTARAERGRALLLGRDGRERDLLAMRGRELRHVRGGEIAMIFQEPMSCLNPVLTVGDQLLEAIHLHGAKRTRAEARAEAVRAMAEVGIAEPERRLKAYPHELSGGMRQRVMIAMALACGPRVLLADEPTTALDATVQAQILELLGSLRDSRGLGILIITHSMGVVSRIADVVCVMYGGRVMEYGDVGVILERATHPYTRALLACAPGVEGGGLGDGDRERARAAEEAKHIARAGATPSLTVGLHVARGVSPGGRLATVERFLSEPGAFAPIRGMDDGEGGGAGGTTGGRERSGSRGPLVAWWPGRERPPFVPADVEVGGDRESMLARVGERHWVRVWANAGLAAGSGRGPGES